MKRLSIILFLLTAFVFAKAQNPIPADSSFPIKQSIANALNTLAIGNVYQGKGGLIVGKFVDTTAANRTKIKFYPGAIVYTTDDILWLRNSTATAWIRGSAAEGNGSITQIDSSTLVICPVSGACDTIHLLNTNTFNIFVSGDTTFLVTCDTIQTICVGDSCYPQQVCDTIMLAAPLPVTIYQNGVRLAEPNIVEWGVDNPNRNTSANIFHETWILGGPVNFHATAGRSIFNIQQNQWAQITPEISSWLHKGALRPGWNNLDSSNTVALTMNYTDPLTIPTNGVLTGDTVGYMGNRYGYMPMTNFPLVSTTAKQVGLFFDTYSPNDEGLSIIAQQVPSVYSFSNTDPKDSTFLSKRVAIFRTTGDITFPFYPSTRNDGTAGLAFYPDADGNVRVGPVSGGSSITIINDTTITICSFGDQLCDTFIVNTLPDPIQYVTVINDSTLLVCDTLNNCDTLDIGGSGGGGTGFDRGFFDPNQTSNGNTYHQTAGYNFAVGRGLTLSPTGTVDNYLFGINHILSANATRNFVALTTNTVSGSENVVFGRNMVVSGNTNFVAATDGTVAIANYSALFGDANDNRGTASLTMGFGNNNFVENAFTGGSDNNNGAVANLKSNTFIYGLANTVNGNTDFVGGESLTITGNNITAFGKSYTETTANSFNVGYTTNAFQITANKVRINSARFQEYKGANITAANDLTVGTDGNDFTVGGATQINAITTTNWQAGSKIFLKFTGAPLVKYNTAGGAGTATILLAGNVDFQVAAGDRLYLEYDGTNWNEIGRTLVASAGGSITADNGTTASTPTNVQLGSASSGSANSPLLHDTYINTGSAFKLIAYGENTSSTTPVMQVFNGSGGMGLNPQTSSGTALQSQSNSGIPIVAIQTNSGSLNAATEILRIDRQTQSAGTAANGIGGYIMFRNETSAAGREANKIISTFTEVTDGTRKSQLDITGVYNGSTATIMSAYGSGVVGIGISSSYTATRLNVVDNSISTVPMIDISSASTGAASNLQKVVNITLSGANATSTQTTFGVYSSNTHSGTSNVNYALYGNTANEGLGSSAVKGVADAGNGVSGTSSSAFGVSGASTSSFGGSFSSNSSEGLHSTSQSGIGLSAQTETGTSAGLLITNPSSTNSITTVLQIRRSSSGSPANGIGGAITFEPETSTTASNQSAQIASTWTDVTNATRTGDLQFFTTNSTASTKWMTIAGDGTVTMHKYGAGAATFDGSGVISSVSDERVKKNINSYYHGLNDIMNINPISYQYNGLSGNETNGTYIGFSAQNIQSALGENAIGRNSQGYLSIQDRAIMATMVNAIKELKSEVDYLKTQIKK